MFVLYEFSNSVCCQKVRLVLCEKGLVWESRQVNLFRSEQYDPEYLKLNPKGVVPTLVHDGRPVIESTLICEYLEGIFPDPPSCRRPRTNAPACAFGAKRWTRDCTKALPRSASRRCSASA